MCSLQRDDYSLNIVQHANINSTALETAATGQKNSSRGSAMASAQEFSAPAILHSAPYRLCAYPILGRRVPLRGYYAKTRDFLQHDNGYYISPDPPSCTDGSTPSDTFKPDIFVAVIPRGRSLYDCGMIVSPDHRLLADVSWEGYDLISDRKTILPCTNSVCLRSSISQEKWPLSPQ